MGDGGGDQAHEQDVGEGVEQHDDVEPVLERALDGGEEDRCDDGLGDERSRHAVQRGAERQPAGAVGEHERQARDAEQERAGTERDADELRHVEPELGPARQRVARHARDERQAQRDPAAPRRRAQHAAGEHEPGAEQEQHGQPGLEGGTPDRPGPEEAGQRDPGHRAQQEDAHGR